MRPSRSKRELKGSAPPTRRKAPPLATHTYDTWKHFDENQRTEIDHIIEKGKVRKAIKSLSLMIWKKKCFFTTWHTWYPVCVFVLFPLIIFETEVEYRKFFIWKILSVALVAKQIPCWHRRFFSDAIVVVGQSRSPDSSKAATLFWLNYRLRVSSRSRVMGLFVSRGSKPGLSASPSKTPTAVFDLKM